MITHYFNCLKSGLPKIILLTALALFFLLGGFAMYNYFSSPNEGEFYCSSNPNDRKYYKIYEENGEFYCSSNPNDRKYYKIYEENGKFYYMSCVSENVKVFIEFEDDLALIREDKVTEEEGETWFSSIGVYKYIDKEGKVVLMPDVYRAMGFSEGLAAVIPYEGANWGYINKNGEMVIEPKYGRPSKFKDGFASVYTGVKFILINNKGEYIRDLDEPLD